ncbi:MAG: PorT family protein [Flavobacteriales bacterium]|nr:PorT family protein [Flavobacteriales bacterium]MCX7767413.1 PorT family protein [Flavobacteriales bacterium]MDW8410171.1 outer membrane beta-barrel protein [Flavobacteriales bacterium]
MGRKPLLLSYGAALSAMLGAQGQVEIGPLAGVNRSITVIGEQFAKRSASPGWMVGALVRFGGRAFAEASPQFITVSEMTEGMEKLRPLAPGESPSLRGKLSVRYLQMPVMACFKVYQQEDLNVHVGMGGTFAFLTGLRQNPFLLQREDFHTTDVAVTGKAGVDFNRFIVDFQYAYGLNPRLRHTASRMQVISFQVAYKLWGQFVMRRAASIFPG